MNRYIIIPAHNEGATIRAVVSQVVGRFGAQVVVVDDGSADRTGGEAGAAGALVIRHPYNLGYGAALQTGYKHALAHGASAVMQMDGDGQHLPDSIEEAFGRVESGECDICVSSRFLHADGYDQGLAKRLGTAFFRVAIRLLCGLRVSDPTSGMKCLSRAVLAVFAHDFFPWDYPDANVTVLTQRLGFRIAEIPAKMKPTPVGRGMHRGVLKIVYYVFRVCLSMVVASLQSPRQFKNGAPQ